MIASEDRIGEIKVQHRKLAGLNMEIFGMYRARELSALKPRCLGAKTVVDLADSKGDEVHQYGAVVSARFVVDAIRELLARWQRVGRPNAQAFPLDAFHGPPRRLPAYVAPRGTGL
ncbi:hypothetical protein HJB89_11210 [Rhizobium sp. NZLR8]|uniref:hypothetical protein n=1 Tax=Rhizobium sp. NZLR8 TaxID=2731104 RepID=UPI001C838373|nr:hypothetical protein [Rhizobium sp. NZLR8]MBX5157690.1 hypothetical protein [Rhizobium sp. NZLR8]